jgi:hypothetical protein
LNLPSEEKEAPPTAIELTAAYSLLFKTTPTMKEPPRDSDHKGKPWIRLW